MPNNSTSLLLPQGHITHAEIQQISSSAPEVLRRNSGASATGLQSLFSASETGTLWTSYENLMLSCLTAGKFEDARECLKRLAARFGDGDERILALKGLVKEAEASSDEELDSILQEYELMLAENGTNIPIHKRRIALLRSMGKIQEAISALNTFLSFSPTDSEAWAELADIYLNQGLYSQATYALEEVLLLMPYAWNLHARLGEVLLMGAVAGAEGDIQSYYAESLKRFCRSIELCEDYLRGYYGLKMVTDRLLAEETNLKTNQSLEKSSLPTREVIERLNEAATSKLSEIVRRYGSVEKQWQGYDAGEIAAARALLAKSISAAAR